MAVLPTRLLEVEFDAGVWTDVFADVADISTRRGRNRESGAFDTGQLLVTLRNATRKYDPDNAAGPYYGKLRPNRRVRMRATYSAVTYYVFVGYIDKIEQVYGGPNDATAVIQVSDFFKLLNRSELPSSPYDAEVADTAPKLWYKLDEPLGSTSLVNSGTLGSAYDAPIGQEEFYTGTVQFGQPGLVVHDPGTAIRVTSTNSAVAVVPNNFVLDHTQAWAVEFWARAAAFADPILLQFGRFGSAGNESVKILWQVSGKIAMVLWNDAGTGYAVESAAAQSLNTTYHFVFRHDSDHTLHVLVNGVDVTTNAGGPSTTFSGTITPAGPLRALSMVGLAGADTVIDNMAIYTGGTAALSTGDAGIHNTAGRVAWNGDTPGTRLQRIAELVSSSGTYTFDAGEPTLQATDLGGTALAYAQKVEETTGGELFVARDGTVTFVGRNSLVTGAYLTSKFTLVDDDSGAGIPYRTVSAYVDEAVLVTRATVSRAGSVAVTYTDTAAVAEFQALDEVHDGLLHASDSYSLAFAQWIVNTHKTPATRVGAIELTLTKDPAAMYPAILALEIGDRVTYKRKPQNTGAVFTQDMRVEAISHDTGGHYWQTRLQLSPFNPAASGYPTGVWDSTNWDQSVWGI